PTPTPTASPVAQPTPSQAPQLTSVPSVEASPSEAASPSPGQSPPPSPGLSPQVGGGPSPSPSFGQPNHDINSYIVFGISYVAIKGAQNNATGRGQFRGGNIGANGGAGGTPADVDICANGKVIMDSGTQVVGYDMNITNNCTVWDVYSTNVSGNP